MGSHGFRTRPHPLSLENEVEPFFFFPSSLGLSRDPIPPTLGGVPVSTQAGLDVGLNSRNWKLQGTVTCRDLRNNNDLEPVLYGE